MIISSLAITAFAQAGLSNFQKTLTYTDGKFTDVSSSDWFSTNVKAAYEYGLVNGVSTTSFGAASNVKISEAIALAARLNSIYTTGSAIFTEGSPWYQVYVDYAVANGIVAKNRFEDYNVYATRLQVAEIFAAALPSEALTEINSINIGDIPDVTLEGSYLGIYTLYRAGILTGKTAAGNFYPTQNILRSEVAAIVTRMANAEMRVKFTIDKSGGSDAVGQIKTTLDTARDEVILAMEYINDAYVKVTSSNYSGAATSMNKATTYAQMATQYAKSAADACKANNAYSGYYNGVYSSYQKCLVAISDMSAIASASYSPTADWATPRTLLNESSDLLLLAYTSIN